MGKLLKVFFILTIMLTFFMNFSVLATNSEGTEESSSTSVTSSSSSNSNNNSSAKVTSQPSLTEGELQITDVLNILLIATGVVIILLAVAILIKLR